VDEGPAGRTGAEREFTLALIRERRVVHSDVNAVGDGFTLSLVRERVGVRVLKCIVRRPCQCGGHV
jgi:hypothetical protein